MSEADRCPICAEPFIEGQLCALDIEMGEAHAACLEGSPIVDLATGEPKPDGRLMTWPYEADAPLPVQVDGGGRS